MQAASRDILQRLISHAHPNDFENFLKYFEENERTLLKAKVPNEEALPIRLEEESKMLHRFHYSWYLESFEKCPKKFRKELLNVFSDTQKEKLSKLVKVKPSKSKPSKFIKTYFTHWFLKDIGYFTLPPMCFYTENMAKHLLVMSKDQLVVILHKLGLLDMANMAKRIVEQKALKELLSFLAPQQRKFFSAAQKKYNEPLSSTTKDLKKKLEDDKTFANFLEKRGLHRLTRASASLPNYFVWHLAHILDKGRGESFLTLFRKASAGPHTPYYFRQLIDLSKTPQEEES